VRVTESLVWTGMTPRRLFTLLRKRGVGGERETLLGSNGERDFIRKQCSDRNDAKLVRRQLCVRVGPLKLARHRKVWRRHRSRSRSSQCLTRQRERERDLVKCSTRVTLSFLLLLCDLLHFRTWKRLGTCNVAVDDAGFTSPCIDGWMDG